MRDFPFHVEIWQSGFNAPYETVAQAISFGMANVVFDDLVKSRPGEFIRLRNGIRVMKQHPQIG
ncbi:hypothetical protein PsAD2_04177 [Pseudovibrio axinellae]|uniref:Uncharacterized protein n=1 Tax=Pseudovibrio axinellae TaxID=989403 RepID=A0A161XC94_9HYPH|nr:hypothetical protein [Pseudovibrio axinellae]KZL07838.1 hypothetical protein PsAD2_04177 [Pseudovibrio axinellae]SER77939.1 hypothetical protein SAMN05421798_12232 [Pseudovibrio axinellae]